MGYINTSALFEEGTWAVVLFLVLAVAIFFAISREKARLTALAIGQSILSFFGSPLRYLRKTVSELALGPDNPRIRDSDHYLIGKFLSALQVALIAAFVLAGAAVLTLSVHAGLPPLYLRAQISSVQEQLAAAQNRYAQATTALKREDDDWQNRRDELIKKADADRKGRISSAEQELGDIERSLQSDAQAVQTLGSIKNYLAAHAMYGREEAVAEAKGFLERLPLQDSSRGRIAGYCDHWNTLQGLLERQPSSPEAIRASVQTDHASLLATQAEEQSRINELTETLQRLDSQKQYRPELFFTFLIVGSLYLLLMVWVGGLLIEGLSLGFYLSNDVKEIRASAEHKGAKVAAGGSE